ncbi:MAG: histidine phosphatase family protein [Candidatus Rokubacteria bacterium]|nr:histidine phosphatase family protein [Candidatus Rokubacteria bacterium]MBI3827552.1 histidine phosphatase family protein [Candidatus Rokubacteria bacterium]
MRLLLARHGQSVWNEVRRFQGTTDVGLSPLGRAQAAALGSALRGRPIVAAYVSPMRRARETAEIALAGAARAMRSDPRALPVPSVPLIAVEELRELSLGEWEGYTVDEIRARDGDPYQAWLRAPLDCPPPGAEPLDAVCERVVRAIDRIVATHHRGEDVLVVAHGGVISTYVCHLLGCSFNALWRFRVDNASLTVVRPPRLSTINATDHLTDGLRSPIWQRPAAASSAP